MVSEVWPGLTMLSLQCSWGCIASKEHVAYWLGELVPCRFHAG